jgi:hypothetical protein
MSSEWSFLMRALAGDLPAADRFAEQVGSTGGSSETVGKR